MTIKKETTKKDFNATIGNAVLGEDFISPKVEMPKQSKSNRYFSEPLMLLVGKRKNIKDNIIFTDGAFKSRLSY